MPGSLDNLKSILAKTSFHASCPFFFFFGHSENDLLLAHLADVPTSEHAVHCFLRVETKTGVHDDVIVE